ncbi:DUF1643 domain-containing protein [Arthrobacter sp. NPDC090010]|uniref:DUF1643 domain-containing protein n=1 Tax=Arthrobacter sp. NPDC090010 TaxID=3363942 RepID=UPI0037FFAA45
MNAMERLGAHFRSRRRELGLSEAEFADHVGISRSQLSDIEAGRSAVLRPVFDMASELGLDVVAVLQERDDTKGGPKARVVRGGNVSRRRMLYPPGHEPDFCCPLPEEQTHRFALGNVAHASAAAPPLVAICMNPSYASRDQADKTVNRLIQASIDNGHPGWLVLNLYPERATDSSQLSPYDPELSAANCAAIEQVMVRFGVTEVLGAWGGLKHATLRRAKEDVLDTLDRYGVNLYMFDGLTDGGDPRHPTPRGPALQMKGEKRYLVRSGNRLVESELR